MGDSANWRYEKTPIAGGFSVTYNQILNRVGASLMAERWVRPPASLGDGSSLHLRQPVCKVDKDRLHQPLEYLVYTCAVVYKIPVHVDNHTPVLPCP